MVIYDDRGRTDVELSSIRARGAILARWLKPVNHASARIPGHISIGSPFFWGKIVTLGMPEDSRAMVMLTTTHNGMYSTHHANRR